MHTHFINRQTAVLTHNHKLRHTGYYRSTEAWSKINWPMVSNLFILNNNILKNIYFVPVTIKLFSHKSQSRCTLLESSFCIIHVTSAMVQTIINSTYTMYNVVLLTNFFTHSWLLILDLYARGHMQAQGTI